MTIKTVRENAPLHQAQQTPLFPLLPQQVHSAPSMAEWGGAGGLWSGHFGVFLPLHPSHTFPLLLHRSSMAAVPLGIPALVPGPPPALPLLLCPARRVVSLTFFLTPYFACVTFLPFLKYIFPKAPPPCLWG